MKNTNFGIEIELTGITRRMAAKVIAEYYGTSSEYVGGGYSTYEAFDSKNRRWKCMSDASILSQKKSAGRIISASEEYRCEVVSPILQYEDITDLQEIVRRLRQKGAIANSSCGIHIHVDAARHTPQTLRNLINITFQKEDLLYKALAIKTDRINYCKKVNGQLLKKLNERKPTTMAQLSDIWYGEHTPQYSRNRHYNDTRYHGVNLHATFTKGTVEFRLFNSTTHAGEIKSYIQFCLAVNNQALSQKSARASKTLTDNEKYTFRCWMLRLGLIGDEFKTCRLHFLKHLTGNSAWRDANHTA